MFVSTMATEVVYPNSLFCVQMEQCLVKNILLVNGGLTWTVQPQRVCTASTRTDWTRRRRPCSLKTQELQQITVHLNLKLIMVHLHLQAMQVAGLVHHLGL